MQRAQFKQFYDTHVDRVYRYLFYRVGGNREVAEDLTSEVFMKALANIDKIDEERYPTAWLMTVTRNHLKNHYRDTKETADIEDFAPFLEETKEKSPEMFAEHGLLLEAIESLPEEDQQIVRMKYLEGFKYKDIGEVLKKTTGAIRIRAHRALKQLRSQLSHDV